MRINILRRGGRKPPVRRERPQEKDPLELLQVKLEPKPVKIEPDQLLEALQRASARPPATQRPPIMQLAERPMTVVPDSGYSRAVRPSGFGHGTVTAAAAASGAAGGTSDSDGDAAKVDPDQFLETELNIVKSETGVDEDLTSLSWLQSKDLLKGIELRPAPEPVSPPALLIQREPSPEPEEASPTSDYADEPFEPSPTFGQITERLHNVGKERDDYAYDPKVHSHVKPPFSFSCLIFMAIEDSRCKALPVREIYGWIQDHFPFYKSAPVGWKNSVRHNLSLSKCFRRSPSQRGQRAVPGKGSHWTVEPEYRTGLIQTLNRSPTVHPRWNSVKLYQGENRRLRVARTKGSPSCYGRAADRDAADEDLEGGPNPQLFPFLAARLMSGPERSPPPGPATDPLAGAPDTPGSRLLTPQNTDKTYLRVREGQLSAYGSRTKPKMLPHFQPVMMISRSAAEDHTYAFPLTEDEPPQSAAPGGPGGPGDGGGSGGGRRHGADSEDEAFSDDSNLSHEQLRVRRGDLGPYSGRSGELTPEEVEGADLLLNLAGVSRAGSRTQSPQPAPAPRRRPGRPRRDHR